MRPTTRREIGLTHHARFTAVNTRRLKKAAGGYTSAPPGRNAAPAGGGAIGVSRTEAEPVVRNCPTRIGSSAN
jgi:hypothetical protein